MKKKRISVLMDSKITKIEGTTKMEKVHFKKEGEPATEYFLQPDVVIQENGLGGPSLNFYKMQAYIEGTDLKTPPVNPSKEKDGCPAADIRFSLSYNNIHSTVFAAGSCCHYPSFMHKLRVRKFVN